ncbi:alpha/beta fold hydrolase [Terricaulis sp.]|uniref:alpha/beta fold hydrolase n=1 Tax=Terricaulis sp. TaxID=2768686 RepID=UPI0037833F25
MRQLAAFICVLVASCATTPAAGLRSYDVGVAEGVRLHVVDAGEGEAAPIIFVPGWSTSRRIWEGQMLRLARQRRVISFDPRAQGASTITPRGVTPEQRAEDLHALIRRWRLARPPVIVGWSQGVQDIAAYVGRYGSSEFAALVLVDAAVAEGAPTGEQEAQHARMMAIYRAHQREYLHGMMQAIIRQPQAPGYVEALVDVGMRTPPEIGEVMLTADLFGADRRGALARIIRPALVIASADSPELERQRAMAASIPGGARFVAIEAAGHAVFIDQPAAFAAALDAFLAAEVDGRSTSPAGSVSR